MYKSRWLSPGSSGTPIHSVLHPALGYTLTHNKSQWKVLTTVKVLISKEVKSTLVQIILASTLKLAIEVLFSNLEFF